MPAQMMNTSTLNETIRVNLSPHDARFPLLSNPLGNPAWGLPDYRLQVGSQMELAALAVRARAPLGREHSRLHSNYRPVCNTVTSRLLQTPSCGCVVSSARTGADRVVLSGLRAGCVLLYRFFRCWLPSQQPHQ